MPNRYFWQNYDLLRLLCVFRYYFEPYDLAGHLGVDLLGGVGDL